ncbi:MAG TPA: adenylate/guanylate cyclase domain-containing protein, partial [Chryseolinea sp.]|nr:adenylate/guanylate cyclase domain-containing protein [Chryseolinea sp.]
GTYLKLQQLKIIVIVWVGIGCIITIYDHLVLHTQNSLGTSETYSILMSAGRNIGAGLIGALIGGSILVFYINVKYPDKPYGFMIFFVSFSFICTIAFITIVMAVIIVPLNTHRPLSDPISIHALKGFVLDSHPLKSAIVWSIVVALTQLMLQVSIKFGPGVFIDLIRGKYHFPIEEKRVFMFLDLNDSTAMAEKLGDEKYHQLLRDFFADITNPILENKGSIYQYVGDEVVISWKYDEGMENATCIHCFFDLKQHIQKHKEKYLVRYGLIPTFKAGIHCGKVVAGEIGIIKRDITYSGDVLNTTSRIQNLCKELDHEVIASADVIPASGLSKVFSTHFLGSIKLRGKEKELQLNGITESYGL